MPILKRIPGSKITSYLFETFKGPTFKQSALCFFQYFLIALAYYIVLIDFDIAVSFNYALLISAALVLASLVSLTPNNLGINEIILAAFIYQLDQSESQYVTIPIILRIAHILSCGFIVFFNSFLFRLKHIDG